MNKNSVKKNIIITGGSDGFGFELVKNFILQNHNVITCARNNKKLKLAKQKIEKIKLNSEQIFIISKVDISNINEAKKFIKLSKQKFKKVDILINNAGIIGDIGSFEKTEFKKWFKALEVNLFGSIYLIKFLLPHFKKQKKGKIIQLSGGGASRAMVNFTSYSVSKTAIVRFVENLSLELKKYNIDINAISPGPMYTNMIDEILKTKKNNVGTKNYNNNLKIKKNNVDSYRKPIELVNFLISNKSDGISGKMISAIWDNYKIWPKYKNKINKKELYVLRRITGSMYKFKKGDKKYK